MRNLKRVLSVALAAVMLLGMMVVGASATSFSDDADIVNAEAAEITAGLGLFAGSDGKFMPNATVTRAQMATIIVKMLYGSEINADQYKGVQKFSDTAAFEGGWAEGYVNLCANLGIVAGYGDGTFKPGKTLSTAEAVTMIINALGVDAGQGTWPLTVMAKAEEMKLFANLTPKPGTNDDLSRDQLASVVLEGLKYSPAKASNYTVPGVPKTFTSYSDALQAAVSVGLNASNIVEVSADDTLANKTFGMKTATGMVMANQATDSAAKFTTVGAVNFNIETGTDLIGHQVTVYYKSAYVSEKDPGVTYAIVDNSEAIALTAAANTDAKFKTAFGSTDLTPASGNVEQFGADFISTGNAPLTAAQYNFATKRATALGTYVVYEGKLIAFVAQANAVAETVTAITTGASGTITLSTLGALANNATTDVVKEYDGIAVGDVVTWIKTGDVYALTKAEDVTGKVTKTTNSNFTVNGKTYTLFTAANNKVNAAVAIPTDFDTTFTFKVSGTKVIDYAVAVDSTTATLANVVYLTNVYKTEATDEFGTTTATVKAQVVDMDGKTANYTVASYKETATPGTYAATVTGSALPASGEFGTINLTGAVLGGDFVPGFYTLKLASADALAKLNIMQATAAPAAYNKTSAPTYAKAVAGAVALTKDTTSITTTDGKAYLNADTKFVVYDGAGAGFVATVIKGAINAPLAGGEGVLLTKDSNGNTVAQVVMVNVDPDSITSGGDFIYVNSFKERTAEGYWYNVYDASGKAAVVCLDSQPAVKKFYTYSVNAKGVYTGLTALTTASKVYTGATFTGAYNGKLDASGGIAEFDASNAKVIDIRSTKTAPASATITTLDELAKLKNDTTKPCTITMDIYGDGANKTVSLIFIKTITFP